MIILGLFGILNPEENIREDVLTKNQDYLKGISDFFPNFVWEEILAYSNFSFLRL